MIKADQTFHLGDKVKNYLIKLSCLPSHNNY